jgi:hypothetical protein
MNKLLADRAFARKTAERYFALRETILGEEALYGYIDSVAAVLDGAQRRHYAKWPILGINVGTPEVDAQPATYAGEITKFKNWIGTRLRWLDSNIAEFIVTATDEIAIQQQTIYPNPASRIVNIQADKEMEQIDVFSFDGNLVISTSVDSRKETALSISEIPSGFYVLKMRYRDGSLGIGKLLKQD